MEEIINVLDEKTGNPTGEETLKSVAHAKGIWHGAVHILIVNEEKTHTLLQKRCVDKELYPDMWDVAVGGHISLNESALTSAKRELEEELGMDVSNLNIEHVKTVKESLSNNGIISNEFVSIFIVYKDINLNELKLQKEEVSEANWFNKEQLNDLINNNQIVPHIEEYKILNDILKH